MEIRRINIDSIVQESRSRQDLGDIAELVESIKEKGLLNPITVCEIEPGRFRLLAGGRRLAACKVANIQVIDANVYDASSELDMLEIELIENVVRKDLEWHEEVALKKKINDLKSKSGNWTQADTADLLGESRPNVTKDIQLAKVVEEVPELANIAKTKAEAEKYLKNIMRKFENKKSLEVVKEKVSSGNIGKKKRALIGSYIVGDSLTELRKLDSESFDLINLDPDYGINIIDKKKKIRLSAKDTEYKQYDGKKDFLAEFDAILKECYRLLAADRFILVWFAWDYFHEVSAAINKAGFELPILVPALWLKGRGQTMRPNLYLARTHEPFFYARKGQPDIRKQGRMDVYEYPISVNKWHPCEKPVNLMEDIFSTFVPAGSNILSPFAGSGNDLLAAANYGCTAVGIDASQEYKDRFSRNVLEGEYGNYTSY